MDLICNNHGLVEAVPIASPRSRARLDCFIYFKFYFAGHYYQLNFDDKSLMSLFHYFSLGGDVQVFSMPAATCALFNKCAMIPPAMLTLI